MRVVKHWHRLHVEVIATPCLSVFERHLGNALSNIFPLVSPEAVRMLDSTCRSLPADLFPPLGSGSD